MLVEIEIQFRGQTVRQQLEVEPTEMRSATSIVESKVKRLAKEYRQFKPKVTWREVGGEIIRDRP